MIGLGVAFLVVCGGLAVGYSVGWSEGDEDLTADDLDTPDLEPESDPFVFSAQAPAPPLAHALGIGADPAENLVLDGVSNPQVEQPMDITDFRPGEEILELTVSTAKGEIGALSITENQGDTEVRLGDQTVAILRQTTGVTPDDISLNTEA